MLRKRTKKYCAAFFSLMMLLTTLMLNLALADGIGYDEGVVAETEENSDISLFSVSNSSYASTGSIGKADYYDDMIYYIEHTPSGVPDLDMQSNAYGTGGYNSTSQWSCSGYVAAVLYHYFGSSSIIGKGIAACPNTAAPDSLEANYFAVSDDWAVVATYTASDSLSDSDKGPAALNQLKNDISSGKIKAGDVIFFHVDPNVGHGVKYSHVGFVSNQQWAYSSASGTVYACLNTSSGGNKIQYSNMAYWFDSSEDHSGASNTYSVGYTVYSKQDNITGSVSLNKTSKLNNYNNILGNKNYSLEGAEFSVYYSATGTPVAISSNYVGKFITNAGGWGYVSENKYGGSTGAGVFKMTYLPLGNYLVVETNTPTGHTKAPNQTFSITESNADTVIELDFLEPALYGELDLVKTSSCTNITNNNDMYDLSGAVYQVYTDAECTQKAYRVLVNSSGEVTGTMDAVFTTDSTGNAEAMHILHGTYYIKETIAPEGFELDTNIYKVVVGKDTTPQANVTIKAGGYHTYDSNRFTLTVSDKPVNDPIEIVVEKTDANGILTGNLPLEGAIFKVSYYDAYYNSLSDLPTEATRNWYLRTKFEDGEYVAKLESQFLVSDETYNSDPFYYETSGRITIPLGTIAISEVQAADGFIADSGDVIDDNGNLYSNRTFLGQIREDASSTYGASIFGINGTVTGVKFTYLNLTVSNAVGRGNSGGGKVALETQEAMSNIPFKLTYLGTGDEEIESHIIVTDQNGKFSSLVVPHSQNTNGNDVYLTTDTSEVESFDVTGIWFYGNSEQIGTVDDSKGALPYGKYRLEELPCVNNADRQLMPPVEFSITEDGQELDLGDLYNAPNPVIGTLEWDAETETHMSVADETVTLMDTVGYKYLTALKTYTIQGIVMEITEDAEGNRTVAPMLDDNGNYITSSQTFTTDEATPEELIIHNKSGSIDMTYSFSGTSLAGKQFVIYEYLFEGEKTTPLTVVDGVVDTTEVMTDRNGELICHTDMYDDNQIGYFMDGHTTALGKDTGDHTVAPKTEVTIVDEITYKGLVPGLEYTATGILMLKETGEPLLDAEGNEITNTVMFIPETINGSAYVEFTFDSSLLSGKQIVVFEEVYYKDILVFVHADLEDEDQTVTVMDLGKVSGLKTDADSGAGLEGAVIGLFDVATEEFTEETAIAVTTSAADGSFSFEGLLFGSYLVREIEAPEGYYLSKVSVPVEVDEDGEVVEITIANAKRVGALKIVKTSSNGVVEGFTFLITGCGMEFTATTDENGEIYIDNLPIGEYTVHEVDNVFSSDYDLPEDKVCVVGENTMVTVTMHNVYNPSAPPATGDTGRAVFQLILGIAAIALAVYIKVKKK